MNFAFTLTEKYRQVIGRLPDLLEHLLVDTLYVIGELHILGIGQPVEDLLLVVDIAVVVDALTLAEVGDTGWITEAVLLRHQPILHPYYLYAVLRCLVVDQLNVSEHSGTFRIFLFV